MEKILRKDLLPGLYWAKNPKDMESEYELIEVRSEEGRPLHWFPYEATKVAGYSMGWDCCDYDMIQYEYFVKAELIMPNGEIYYG